MIWKSQENMLKVCFKDQGAFYIRFEKKKKKLKLEFWNLRVKLGIKAWT